MDTRELLKDIAETLREFAYTQQQREEYYLLKLADTIDNALEESEE